MSGPGGPAKPTTIMTPPSGLTGARAMQQVKANVRAMIDGGASEDEIDSYLSHEGLTAQDLATSPAAAPGQITGATPVASAYQPTTGERMRDLNIAQQKGVKAPTLPNNAPISQRVMDWLDTLGDAAKTTARGFTFGTFDEAGGAGDAAAAAIKGQDAGKAFQQGSDAVNARIAQFKAANPVLGYTLEGIGMAASPLSRIGADWQMAGPTMFNRALRAGVVGAGTGAATGAAYDGGDLMSRLQAGGWGAVIGAPVGAVVAPAVETATRTGQTFMDVLNARRAAANDPAARARAMVATAIARDQMTPTPQAGEALVSAGGPNVQALGRQATVAPGNARAVAAQYFEGAAADLPEAIGQAARQNIASKNLFDSLDEYTKNQKQIAGPLYQQADAANPRVDTSQLLKTIDAELRTAKGGIRVALQRARSLFENADGSLEGSLSGLHQTKIALDDMIDGMSKDSSLGRVAKARVVDIKNNLMGLLRKASPEYDQAANIFAGEAALKGAAQDGAAALSSTEFTPVKIKAFQSLSPSEQDAFRIGLAQAVIERAGKMGPNTDPVNLFLKGKNANLLMRTYLPDQESFDAFVNTLQQQSRIVQASRKVLGGSPTAPRIAEGVDAAQQEQALMNQLTMARDAWNLATGRGGGRVNAAVNIFNRGRNAATGVSEPVADELGRMLFNPDQAANLATVRGVSAQVPAIQANQAAQDYLRRYLATYGTLPMAPVGAAIGAY